VTEPRVTALVAAQDLDAHAFLGAGVVGHVKVCIHLDHDRKTFPFPVGDASQMRSSKNASSRRRQPRHQPVVAAASVRGACLPTRSSRQFLFFDNGRVSMISTVSPMRVSLFSSWT